MERIHFVSSNLIADKHELLEGSKDLIYPKQSALHEVAHLIGTTTEESLLGNNLSSGDAQKLARLRSEAKQVNNQIAQLEHQREQLDMKAGHDIEAIIHEYEFGE